MTGKRSYLWLLGAVIALALALSAAARAPGRRAREISVAPSPAPAAALAIEIRGGQLAPSLTQARKGERITLHVTNAGPNESSLALLGYEDRLPRIVLAPGSDWRGELVADRPGDDFAWMVDGKPAGRFIVQGSHLVEGHR